MKERILIFFLTFASEPQRTQTWLSYMADFFGHIYVVPTNPLHSAIVLPQPNVELCLDLSKSLPGIREQASFIYLANDLFSLPLSTPADFFSYAEAQFACASLWDMSDLLGEETPSDLFFDSRSANVFPFFLSVKASATHWDKLTTLLADSTPEAFSFSAAAYISIRCQATYFQHLKAKSGFYYSPHPVPFAYAMYDYVSQMQFPFVCLTAFHLQKRVLIQHGTDNRPNQLLSYLTQKHPPVAANLMLFLTARCDVAFLKDYLNLNFILSPTMPSCHHTAGESAVFVHLHYAELFEENLNQLRHIPLYCDLFLSVGTAEKAMQLQTMAKSILRRPFHVIQVQNRGRDLSALLVGFQPYTRQYHYFCFLHDKKAHKEEINTVGGAFNCCIWENLIGSEAIISGALELLENNSYLGLLAPPPPYWGNYLHTKSNYWTICYEKTLALAQALSLPCTVSNSMNPVAIGTAFWCKTDALQSLLSRPWGYTDFDPEPLPLDGTRSHALERIFPYVAQSNHYLTGWLISTDWASCFLESHNFLLEGILHQIDEQNLTPLFQETLGRNVGFRMSLSTLGYLGKRFLYALKQCGIAGFRFLRKKLP